MRHARVEIGGGAGVRLANVDGRAHLLVHDRLVDIEHASSGRLPADPIEILLRLDELGQAPELREAPGLPAAETKLGPPVPRPSKILAAGGNYLEHIEEGRSFDVPDEPTVFAKLPSALVGPTDEIVLPVDRPHVDWEAELVVIIGKRARNVAIGDAWTHVAGLTCGQDISDRDEQFRGSAQWTMAKSFDTYAPTGPYLVTLDEITSRDALTLRCLLDGEEVQRGTTAKLIFSVPVLISWISRVATLEPGGLLFTGTPAGVGAFRDPPRWLSDGQLLQTIVPGVGEMANPVRSAARTGPAASRV